WQLMLRNRATGESRSLSADFDSSIESIAWTSDSQSLVLEAEEKGAKALWTVAVSGGDVKPLVKGGSSGEAAVTSAGQVFFTRTSLTEPAEILRVTLKSGSLQPMTRVNVDLLTKLTL